VKFLVDAQLPPGLVKWLNDQGHDSQHVDYCGLNGANDITIWNYAISAQAIILTKDEDFAERTARTPSGPTIVWLRLGNATNRVLFAWLEPRWGAIEELLASNNRLIEVR
jgi:predicted nuclease of predicted toxin-antitoxin system